MVKRKRETDNEILMEPATKSTIISNEDPTGENPLDGKERTAIDQSGQNFSSVVQTDLHHANSRNESLDDATESDPREIYTSAEMQLRNVMDDFVRLYERLCTTDDPGIKPNYSYSELVFLAILRSPNFCLPISEIYKYIQSRFSFFRNSTRQHWRNAVRHSLSKTKCFSKISVGKGVCVTGKLHKATYLWCIVPSSIVAFARGDYRPSVDKESGTNTLQYGYYRVNAGQFWGQVAVYLERKMVAFRNTIAQSTSPGTIFEQQLCRIPDRSEILKDENFFENVGSASSETVHGESSELPDTIGNETQKSKTPKTSHSIHNMLNLSKGAKDSKETDDSGIVSDAFITNYCNDFSNFDSEVSFTEASFIEQSLNLLTKSENAHTSSPFQNGIMFPQDSNQLSDDRKTPELRDLQNVSPFRISPLLSPINGPDLSLSSDRQSPPLLRSTDGSFGMDMSHVYPFYHSSPFSQYQTPVDEYLTCGMPSYLPLYSAPHESFLNSYDYTA